MIAALHPFITCDLDSHVLASVNMKTERVDALEPCALPLVRLRCDLDAALYVIHAAELHYATRLIDLQRPRVCTRCTWSVSLTGSYLRFTYLLLMEGEGLDALAESAPKVDFFCFEALSAFQQLQCKSLCANIHQHIPL